MSITIEPIKRHIGANVHVDRAHLLDADVVRKCSEALEDRCVLVFPRMGLTDEEQLAFTECLGARVDFARHMPGQKTASPGIYKVTLDPELNDRPEYVMGSFFWHMDGMTFDVPLPKATLLTARRLAPKGGDTEFSSTVAAYENLPPDEKADLEGLRVVHSAYAGLRPQFESSYTSEDRDWIAQTSKVKEHPLVWQQKSGCKSLILGITADYIKGKSMAEGRALLARLVDWTVQPDFTYRHKWQEGDLIIWNNYSALHRVVPYDIKSGRLMHRTSIAGVEFTS
jgi:alpha-ketoglutarate-dependent taurine dioxygenase